MNKCIEKIFFDQKKSEYIIEHSQGIDRFSIENLKNISYKKLPLDFSEMFDEKGFVKDGEVQFQSIISSPFSTILSQLKLLFLGVSLFFPILAIYNYSNYYLFVKDPIHNQTKALIITICLFVVVFLLVHLIFYLINYVLDLMFSGKVRKYVGFDSQLNVFADCEEQYYFDSESISIYSIFKTEGISVRHVSNDSNLSYWIANGLKISLFGCIAYLSMKNVWFNEFLASLIDFDKTQLNIFINSDKETQSLIMNQVMNGFSTLNFILYYLQFGVLILIGIIGFFVYGFNMFFLILTLLIGPYIVLFVSFYHLFLEAIRSRIHNFSEFKLVVKFSEFKLSCVFIVLLSLLWIFGNNFTLLDKLTLIFLLISVLIHIGYIIFFTARIQVVKVVPVSLKSDEYIADYLVENNRFEILQQMNYRLFLGNSNWVETKLLKGYNILPYCSDAIKLKFDKYYYLEYLKEERNNIFSSVSSDFSLNNFSLQQPSSFFSNNREVVLEMLNINGKYLKYASRWMRSDLEIVKIAVQLNGLALAFANEKLQNNKEVVLLAVRCNGNALKFASMSLCADKEVVLEALKSNKSAEKYINSSLKFDEDILKILNHTHENNKD